MVKVKEQKVLKIIIIILIIVNIIYIGLRYISWELCRIYDSLYLRMALTDNKIAKNQLSNIFDNITLDIIVGIFFLIVILILFIRFGVIISNEKKL